MATTARSISCRPPRALTSERNSCCFAGRCSWYLARKRGRDSCESHGELPHQAACVCGGGRVARLFCQRGDALEGLVGPCEAGARTAAPAQEAGSSTAQREKRQETVCISVLDSDVWAFLPPIYVVTRVPRDWWFPGRNSPEFFQKVSKVEHIAPACCQRALKPTLLHNQPKTKRALPHRDQRCSCEVCIWGFKNVFGGLFPLRCGRWPARRVRAFSLFRSFLYDLRPGY